MPQDGWGSAPFPRERKSVGEGWEERVPLYPFLAVETRCHQQALTKKKTYLFVSGVRWLPANLCMCALTITGKNKDKEEGKKTQANKIFIYVDIQKVVVVVVAGGGKSVS